MAANGSDVHCKGPKINIGDDIMLGLGVLGTIIVIVIIILILR